MVKLATGGKQQRIGDTNYQGKKEKREPTVTTTLLIPKSIHKALKLQSIETGESMSKIVSRLVRESLEKKTK